MKSNNDNFRNAICYIPFVSIWLFFTYEKKTPELHKHIKYGTFLFVSFILVRFLFIGILMLPIGGFLFLIYAGISGFLGWKAYNGEKIDIEYIDSFEEKVKKNLK